MSVYASVCAVCTFVCTCTVCGCVSHPGGASVSRIRGGHGHGATPSLRRAGALEHAGMKAWMSPGVFLQVVAPHEALVTHGTVEALFACVRAIVTGELVRSGELLAAACPGTLKGALTGMDPKMGFKVGRLAVHLPAASKRAAVSLLGAWQSPRRRRLRVPGMFGLAGRRAAAVPAAQPTPPLRFLLRAGLAAPETSVFSGADSVGAAFVQVQQNPRHHQ